MDVGKITIVPTSETSKKQPPPVPLPPPRVEWFQMKMILFVERNGPECLSSARAKICFSNNNLSDEGLRSLLEVLLNFNLHIAQLQLSGNDLTSSSMTALADFLMQCPSTNPLWELHLSHNRIEAASVQQFFRVVNRDKRFPPVRDNRGKREHFVVHLNNNLIENPGRLIQACK